MCCVTGSGSVGERELAEGRVTGHGIFMSWVRGFDSREFEMIRVVMVQSIVSSPAIHCAICTR